MSVNSTQSNRPTLAQMKNFASKPLKLSNNFNASAIAGSIATGGGKSFLTRSNYSLLNNSIFTPARGPGDTIAGGGSARTSMYYTNQQLSSMKNYSPRRARGQMPFIPAYSSATTASNVTVKGPDTWTTIGSILGTILPAVPGVIGSFSKSDTPAVKPQGANGNEGAAPAVSRAAQEQVSKIAVSVPASAATSVSSYISAMTDAKDKPTLQSAITSAQTQLTSLSNETSVYESAAKEEAAELAKLQGQTATLAKTESETAGLVKQADGAVQTQQTQRDAALKDAQQFGEGYKKAVEEFTKAHDANIEAAQAEDGAQKAFDRADATWKDAQANSKTAQAGFNEAKQAYDSCPKTRIDPKTQQEVPNEPQLSEARAKMNVAQEKLRAAKQAEEKALTAKNEASNKLGIAKKQHEATKGQEATAKAAKDKAYEALGDKKTQAKAFEEKLKAAQDKLDSFKGKAEAARENHAAAEAALQQHNIQMEGLESCKNLLSNNQQCISDLNQGITDANVRISTLPDKVDTGPPADGTS